jgi:putative ABC transport system permease protein
VAHRASRIGSRLYALLLRAFPSDVRDSEGPDMAAQFAGERAARRGRPVALARLWIAAFADALWNGLLERLSVRAAISARRGGVEVDADPGWSRRSARFLLAALNDLRISVRRLAAAPSFTLVAVLTLALGIGANSAIFSVVYGVLLRPLPFPEPDRLVALFHVWEGKHDVFSSPNFLDVQARARTLQSSAAFYGTTMTLTNAGDPASLTGTRVTAGFFETMAVPPLHGRTFRPDDNETGRHRVVVLGHALWRDRFGSDPAIVGRRITLDGDAHEVVGVMPAGFQWPTTAELWLPAEYDESFLRTNRGAWYLSAVGRLAPDAEVDQAIAEMNALGRRLEQEHPDMNARLGMTAHPLLDAMVGDTRRSLLVLLAAVAFVLLIACANVANLLLARASARQAELAVRVALGASRLQIVRQLLVESLLLAGLGGLAGLLLAIGGTRFLVYLQPSGIPRLSAIAVDTTVVLCTLGAALVTGVLFGLVPAAQSSGRSVEAIHERGRSGTAGRRSQRLRGGLVVAETALALMLLAGAGLLIRSFVKLTHVDPGFNVGQALTFRVALPRSDYPDDERRLVFFDGLRERLSAMPGVAGVGAVLAVPPGSSNLNLTFTVSGRPPAPPGQEPALEIRIADAEYFRVMGIPLRRGRLFEDADRAGDGVVVLAESAVQRHFAGEDPLGRRIEVGWNRNGKLLGGTVVGVVGDVLSHGLDQAPPPQVYFPLAQAPNGSMSFVMRTEADPASYAGAVRATVGELDPRLPVTRVQTLAAHVRESIAEPRFYMLLLGLFAGVAVALAAIGIFGVLAYLVAQRAREIGVRLALGARPRSVVALVLRRAVLLVGIGVAIGLAGAMGLTRWLQSLLFELDPMDPVTLASSAAGLMFVAVVAAWIPARRASNVDPVTVLRD